MTQETDPAAVVESAKRAAAFLAVEEHFRPSMTHVGIGSGSTVAYVVEAIAEAMLEDGSSKCVFVPTGSQSLSLIEKAGLTAVRYETIEEQQMLDVAFDGADEVDAYFNMVKGGGLCLFQEKLVAIKARSLVCVADYRKDSDNLLTTWPYIPIEVAPIATSYVISALKALGSPNPKVRTSESGEAVLTDQNFHIVMAPFPPLLSRLDPVPAPGAVGKTSEGLEGRVWEAEKLAAAIKAIPGVLEVGLFTGLSGIESREAGGQGGQRPVAAFFGLSDGKIKTKIV